MSLLFHGTSELPNFFFSLSSTQLSPFYIMFLRKKSIYCMHGKKEKYRKSTISSALYTSTSGFSRLSLGYNTLTLGVIMSSIGFLWVTCSGHIFSVQKRDGRSVVLGLRAFQFFGFSELYCEPCHNSISFSCALRLTL